LPVNGVALLVAAGAGLRRGSPSPLALSWPTCAPYVVLLVSMISWSWVGLRASGPDRVGRRSFAAKGTWGGKSQLGMKTPPQPRLMPVDSAPVL